MGLTPQKTYAGGGVILLVNSEDKDFIVFPMRSNDAPVNPGAHSGFFGGIEASNEQEQLNPDLICIREFQEELLITSLDRKVYHLVFPDEGSKTNKHTNKLITLWKSEMEVTVEDDHQQIISGKKLRSIEYSEHDGWKRILIVRFAIPALSEVRFFDGETKSDYPPCGLLDRQIDVFDLGKFQDWWFNRGSLSLVSAAPFKTGRSIDQGFISRERNKISSSLILALNIWRWWE